jgi:hypothetical protein
VEMAGFKRFMSLCEVDVDRHWTFIWNELSTTNTVLFFSTVYIPSISNIYFIYDTNQERMIVPSYPCQEEFHPFPYMFFFFT